MDDVETAGTVETNSDRALLALEIAIDAFPVAMATLLLLVVYLRVTD